MTQTISGVVVKRNRVNLSVRLDGRDKPVNLRIDETTGHLQAGDRFTLRADPVYRAGRFQGFEAASKETLAREQDRRADQWETWTRERAEQGAKYRKGLAYLREHGRADTADRLETLADNTRAEHLADTVRRIAREQGVLWTRGVAELRDMGRADLADTVQSDAADTIGERLRREGDANRDSRTDNVWGVKTKWARVSDDVGRRLRRGDVLFWQGAYGVVERAVLHRATDDDDGWSFGVDSDDWYGVELRWVPQDDGRVAACRAREEREKMLAGLRADSRRALDGLVGAVRGDGDPIGRAVMADLLDGADMVCDTTNIYGGGFQVFVRDGAVWYVERNHMDGDNWGLNTIRGGGYGWRAPASGRVADLLGRYRSLRARLAQAEGSAA